jgi:acyl-CoA thioester hydrolase
MEMTVERCHIDKIIHSHGCRHVHDALGLVVQRQTAALSKLKQAIMVHPHLDGAISDGLHRMQVRVYYEDTDFSGIVYHANYLRFMERGRTNYLRLLGADQRALFAEAESEAPGFAFVVRAMTLEFLKPSRMDDLLEIVTRPIEVRGASITLGQEVRRGDALLLEAKVKVAFVSGGRAKAIPKALRIAMQADQL